jgi:hypothetical protein
MVAIVIELTRSSSGEHGVRNNRQARNLQCCKGYENPIETNSTASSRNDGSEFSEADQYTPNLSIDNNGDEERTFKVISTAKALPVDIVNLRHRIITEIKQQMIVHPLSIPPEYLTNCLT